MLANELVNCNESRMKTFVNCDDDHKQVITMIITNDYLDHDEAREPTSSNAMRVAINHGMVNRDNDCNEP